MKEKVICVSEDEELYRAFRRSLKVVGNIEVVRKGFSRNKDAILLYVDSNQEIESWLYGRIRKRYLNPIIVLGCDTKDDFEKSNPVFQDHPFSHTYISIPFKLRNLIEKISNCKAIYDSTTRRMIYGDYCRGYESKLITHDLKILSGDKESTIENFCNVRDFYKGKGDKNTFGYIAGEIKKISEKEDWEQIALNAKKVLVDRLKKGESSEQGQDIMH